MMDLNPPQRTERPQVPPTLPGPTITNAKKIGATVTDRADLFSLNRRCLTPTLLYVQSSPPPPPLSPPPEPPSSHPPPPDKPKSLPPESAFGFAGGYSSPLLGAAPPSRFRSSKLCASASFATTPAPTPR